MAREGIYAWYRDDELVLMLNRYADRAPSVELAGAKLKAWLGQEFLLATNTATVEKRGPGRPRKVQVATPAPTPVSEPPQLLDTDRDNRVVMTRKEVAAYIGRSVKTVEYWASKERGPPFSRRGGVRYYKDEVDAWLEGDRFHGE